MRSLITNYALEGKTAGEPNGHFYLTKDATKAASTNVVKQHFSEWSQQKTDEFIGSTFNKLYQHYDVNNEGFLDADRVPPLLR
jgi:uncharacterized protein YyaL (SSP411 family)